MDQFLIESAETIGLFCRLQMNGRRNLPIRASEMGLLIYVSRENEPVTPLALSQFFKITKPSVTTMVSALVTGGYLEKLPSVEDKRSYSVRLTEKGAQLVRETFDVYYTELTQIRSGLGEADFLAFMKLLGRVNGILQEGR